MSTSSPSTPFRGVPSFFRACVSDVQLGLQPSYALPAYELCRHLRKLIPAGLDAEQWQAELDELGARLQLAPLNGRGSTSSEDRSTCSVWAWFAAHYPRCMA